MSPNGTKELQPWKYLTNSQSWFYSSFSAVTFPPRRKLHLRATWFFILAALVSERSFDFPIAPATIRLVELGWRIIGPRYLPFLEEDSLLIRERERELQSVARFVKVESRTRMLKNALKFRCSPLERRYMIKTKKMERIIEIPKLFAGRSRKIVEIYSNEANENKSSKNKRCCRKESYLLSVH